MAKDLMNEHAIDYTETVLNADDANYEQMRDALWGQYNHKSFPIILDNVGNVIGGFHELEDRLVFNNCDEF